MGTDYFLAILAILGAGIYLLYIGLRGLYDYQRKSYIYPWIYAHYTASINYAGIPFGITFISWFFIFTLLTEFETWFFISITVSFFVGFMGIVFAMLQPKFMMPQWYRWLVENHGEIMSFLRTDVREMGYDVWEKRTKTQEGLEEWVAEVRLKHGLIKEKSGK